MITQNSIITRLKQLLSEESMQQLVSDNQTPRMAAGISNEEFASYEAYAQQLRKEKRWRDASDLLFFLLFLEPTSISCWMHFGQVELEHGSPSVALGAFQTILAREPTKQSTYFKAVEACLKMHQPIIGLYYLELFKCMFPSQEQRQSYLHQITLLEQECERELELHPPNQEKSYAL